MFDKLDKEEKELKYFIPYKKKKKIWSKKMEIYKKKYEKKIINQDLEKTKDNYKTL